MMEKKWNAWKKEEEKRNGTLVTRRRFLPLVGALRVLIARLAVAVRQVWLLQVVPRPPRHPPQLYNNMAAVT